MFSVPFWTQGYGFLYLHLREGLSTHTSPLLWMGNCCARRQRPRSYEAKAKIVYFVPGAAPLGGC